MQNKLYDLKDDILRFQDTSSVPLPNSIVPCLLCTKPFMMLPFIGEPDQVCPECVSTYQDTAKVVCRQCRITIGRVPSRILENGFYIRPKSVLHSTACNICRPGITESTIVEIDQWQKMVRPKKIIIGGQT